MLHAHLNRDCEEPLSWHLPWICLNLPWTCRSSPTASVAGQCRQLRTAPWIWKISQSLNVHIDLAWLYILMTVLIMHKALVRISSFKDWKVTKELNPHIRSTNYEGMNSKHASVAKFHLSVVKEIHQYYPLEISRRVNFIWIFSFDNSSPFTVCRHTICNLLTWMWLL